MSSQSPQSPDMARLDALSKEIAALEDRADALISALKIGARVRQILLIVVVAVLALFIGWLYTTGKGIREDPTPIANAAMQSLLDNQQEFERQGRLLMDNAWPVLRKALENQLEKDMPKFTAELNKQWELMQPSLRSKLNEFIAEQYDEAVKKHERVLIEKFPEIKDEETRALMIAHFREAIEPIISQYYGDRLVSELKQIGKTLEEFPRATVKGDTEKLADELYTKLWELFIIKVSVLSEPEKPQRRPGG